MKLCKNKALIYFVGLVFLFIMLIPAMADYIPPGGSGSGRITLGESPATTCSITAPSDISGWQLSPHDGVNTRVGVLKVSADGDWQVTVNDADTTNTDGYMTEWDGSDNSYITSNRLSSPMSVSVESGENIATGYDVTLPTGGTIADGGSTESVEKDVEVTFKQPVSWNDKVLTDEHSYRIVVTFTISSNS